MDLHGGFFDEAVGLTAPSREIWAAGLGARLGFLVAPQILTYVNGGYTPTRYDNVNFPGTTVSLPGQTFNGGFNGGGTEVAVAAVPGLYWRNEYRLSSYRATNLQFSRAGKRQTCRRSRPRWSINFTDDHVLCARDPKVSDDAAAGS